MIGLNGSSPVHDRRDQVGPGALQTPRSDGRLARWISTEGGGARASFHGCLSLPIFQRFATLVAISDSLLSIAEDGGLNDVEAE
jgi:hypothetical protein